MRIFKFEVPSKNIYLTLSVIVFCVALLTSCASHTPPRQAEVRRGTPIQPYERMMGMTAEEVFNCMGQATQTQGMGDRQVLTFAVSAPAPPRNITGSATPRNMTASAVTTSDNQCTLTLEMRAGVVTSVSYYKEADGRPGDYDPKCRSAMRTCGR